MSRHEDRVYLLHMRDHALEAIAMSQGKTCDDLSEDSKLRYALLHLVCITGEAASHVSSSFRTQYEIVPWRKIIGMRNVIIHGYDVVEHPTLWDTIELELPDLVEKLETILTGM